LLTAPAVLAQPTATPPTVKLSPRARVEPVPTDLSALVSRSGIDAFLAEVDVVALSDLERMPRIVATPESRLILGQGDRAFARTGSGTTGPFFTRAQGAEFRIGRTNRPLRDPATGEVLGHEVQFVGKASLLEEERLSTRADGTLGAPVVPAVLRITGVKEEVRIGDRLFPVATADFKQLKPSQPTVAVQGQVLGVYGNAVTFAGQNQVVVINRGTSHGLQPGHLLSVLKDSRQVVDRTDGQATPLEISGENNGRLVVFRSFDKVAYALILSNLDALKVGDRITDR
jgi:hypothetical protein